MILCIIPVILGWQISEWFNYNTRWPHQKAEDMDYKRPIQTAYAGRDLAWKMAAASIVFRDNDAYSRKLIKVLKLNLPLPVMEAKEEHTLVGIHWFFFRTFVITVFRHDLDDHKNKNGVATDFFCTGVIGHSGYIFLN